MSDEFYVVRNHEEQYSIWRLGKPVPAGWVTVGEPAAREECLATIDEMWTDMRPASLRASMAAAVSDGDGHEKVKDIDAVS